MGDRQYDAVHIDVGALHGQLWDLRCAEAFSPDARTLDGPGLHIPGAVALESGQSYGLCPCSSFREWSVL